MMEWIISSSVLIAAVWAGRALLKGKISLRLQYSLWALVLVRLLVPVSLFDSPISVQNVVEQQEIPRIYEDSYVRIPVRDYETAYEQVVQRYEAEGVEITPSREPMIQKEAHRQMNLNLSLDQIVKAVWLAGMAVMGIGLVASNAHFYLRLRRSRKTLEAVWVPVKVYTTGAVRTPCLYGVFRPAIYVTPEVAADEKTLKYVLNHEVTHFRHFDHIWAALRSLCLVLHWYNPLVWVAAKLSRQDCEMACDEGTLMLLGEENRGDYGRTLVDLTCHAGHPSLLISATTMTGGKREMKERIVLLMKHPKTALITAIAVALCGAILIGCTFTGAGETTEPKNTEPAGNMESTENTNLNTNVSTEPSETTDPEETLAAGTFVDEERIKQEIYMTLGGNDHYVNHFDIAMFCEFEDPRDVDVGKLFSQGYKQNWMPQEEKDYLTQLLGKNISQMTVCRVSGEQMNEVLMKCFGITMEESKKINLDHFYYYEPNDAYLLAYGEPVYYDTHEFELRILSNDRAEYIHYPEVIYQMYKATLVKQDGQWIIESNVPYDYILPYEMPEGAVRLTKDQVAHVYEEFWYMRSWEEDGLFHASTMPVNGFFRCFYSAPEEIRLVDFLRYFSSFGFSDRWYKEGEIWRYDQPVVTDEEFEHLKQLDNCPFADVENLDQLGLQLRHVPEEDVDAVIYHYTEVHLDELHDAGVNSSNLYSEKYGAYYSISSDFGPGTFYCIDGYIYQDTVVLFALDSSVSVSAEGDNSYYWGPTVLTLREEDGRYYIVSHLPLEAE